jgi:hypothetical protein
MDFRINLAFMQMYKTNRTAQVNIIITIQMRQMTPFHNIFHRWNQLTFSLLINKPSLQS